MKERGEGMEWLAKITDAELLEECERLIPCCWRADDKHDLSQDLFYELLRRYKMFIE